MLETVACNTYALLMLITWISDASRFLAQSQSHISFSRPTDNDTPARSSPERHRKPSASFSRHPNRSYYPRPGIGNPYQPAASHLLNLPFASRLSAAPDAPLFHSARDEFREEDDEEERERDAADFYALQRSRRVFGASRVEEGSETDGDGSNASIEERGDDGRAPEDRGQGRGIRSSWKGGKTSMLARGETPERVPEDAEDAEHDDLSGRRSSDESSKGKGRMVDVGLESTIADSEVPDDLVAERDLEDGPPAFQQFQTTPRNGPILLTDDSRYLRQERDSDIRAFAGQPGPPSSVDTVPPTVATPLGEPPKHDVFWGSLYLIALASLFATFFLVFLHTSPPPSGKHPLGDTIYTTLHSSFHLLAVDTVVAVIVALVWLALLRSFVRPLVYLILVSVPIILVSFSLYPMVASYKGPQHGNTLQDRVMRWLSFVPGLGAMIWVYTAYKGRHCFVKAIGILEFASRILAANPALLALGFATLAAVITWTWMWLGMFTRVFLSGHYGKSSIFIIDMTTWWLGACFVLMYIWTLSIISGIQRSTTAATVSQWYFHRSAVPAQSSRDIVIAAFIHATTTLFGTISLSTLLALLVRLPLIVLPKRLVGIVAIFAYSLIPTPITALINPLTLTYAAIHSQPLQVSSRSLSQMSFLTPAAPTTTLTPRSFSSRSHNSATPLLPYRLAKLLLHATRFMMSMGLGFGGWVATARQLPVDVGMGLKGSAYAYVVGLVAGFIGWGVLGAMEGILSGIVDASVVCWGSEKGMAGARAYCLEAGYLFGEERGPRGGSMV